MRNDVLLIIYLTAGCRSEPSCLRCGSTGCVKCRDLIVLPGRNCVNRCPTGHTVLWSTTTDVMGKACVPSRGNAAISSATLTVLTGIVCGVFLCAIMISCAVVYLLRRRRNALERSSDTSSDLDDCPERRDFLKQLETLRPYAYSFLDMLNDTRKHMREHHRLGDNAAMGAYRPVIKDLAKVLFLLNRPVEGLGIPDDWDHLFNWAEKTLKRYTIRPIYFFLF